MPVKKMILKQGKFLRDVRQGVDELYLEGPTCTVKEWIFKERCIWFDTSNDTMFRFGAISGRCAAKLTISGVILLEFGLEEGKGSRR